MTRVTPISKCMLVILGLIWAPAAVRGQDGPPPAPGTPPTSTPPASTPPDGAPATPPPGETAPQTAPETTPAPEPAPELSGEELAEIEAALGRDAAAQVESSPAPARPTGMAAALQSLNPDISFVADVALAWLSSEGNLQSGGHDPARTGFTLQQLEMAIGSAVDPYFRVDGNIVFGQFGVEIEEIYATTLSLPWSLQARVGQFLTRFGRINATHPHQWDFVDQAFAIGRYFGAEGNRGLGAELSYLTPLPWYVEIVGSVTEAGGEATARSFFGREDLPVESPLDFQSTLAIEQFFALGPDWSLLWGLSAATGPNGTGHDNRSDVYGVDVYLKYRPITRQSDTIVALQAEWFHRRRQVPRDLLADSGGYAYASWRFDKHWATALRYELGLPAENRAGDTGGDYLDPEWTESRQRVSANVTYWPTEFSRIRAQGSIDAPGWRDDPIYALMLAFEFTIGAHGAHAF
jgi:hypothetical protein